MTIFEGSDRRALGLWLDVTASAVRSSGPDLTARQTALMLIVYLEPGPHTVRALAERLHVGKPAIVRAIDTLEQAGLVARTPDPRDRRSVFIVRTDWGAERLADYARLIARNIAAMSDPMSGDAEKPYDDTKQEAAG